MAILVDEKTRVIIQGITGSQGNYHAKRMLEYGVNLIGGTVPGRGGSQVHGLPVYDTVAEICCSHQVDATMIIVPPALVGDAVLESIDSQIPLIVVITEHVPVHDTMNFLEAAAQAGVRVVGPNTIGVISPGKSKVGIMPGNIYSQGPVGIISRSGTLTHEISSNLTYRSIGQSSCVGIGGDPITGTKFVDVLELFKEDPETQIVVMIGEIGGTAEEKAADYLQNYPKPVIAYIAGQSAPPGKQMGHAGAIVQGGMGTAQSKMERLLRAGVKVAPTIDGVLDCVMEELFS